MSIRILTVDIETRPNLAYVWGLWDQNVALNQVDQFGRVISWAAKWHGERKVHFASDYHDGHKSMIFKIWDLLDEADVVVGFNSKSFDMKHLNREFLMAGLPPPSHYVDVDLLTVVKQRFRFASNKLQHVASELGLGSKVQHDGFDLWLRCMKGEDAAWKIMRKYNKQDVVLTENLYNKLLPWIKSHPHRGLYGEDKSNCPRCGHNELVVRRYYTTRTGKYRTMQCKGCKGYSKGNKVEDRVTTSSV